MKYVIYTMLISCLMQTTHVNTLEGNNSVENISIKFILNKLEKHEYLTNTLCSIY